MDESVPAWHSQVHCILPHPFSPRMLLLSSAAGWVLPAADFPDYQFFSRLGRITQAMQAQFHLPVTALRCVSYHADETTRRFEMIAELENHARSEEPPRGGQWVGRAELAGLALAMEPQRSELEAYLAEVESGNIPSNRRPWARPGWHAGAYRWIETQLTTMGCTLTAPIEQFDSWGLTCLLRAATDHGVLYFKAAPALPFFANEPVLMAALVTQYPAHIPRPVAVEPERRWMLLADFGPDLGDAPLDVRTVVFRTFGQLQVAAAADMGALFAMGCVDRRLEHLRRQIAPLVADPETVAGLPSEELARLRALVPQLQQRCDQLERYHLPQTLLHGDLSVHNTAGSATQPLFFDWTEGSVGHPFFDMSRIYFEDDASVQAQLRDAYLTNWVSYEPMERLVAAWLVAKPLCALHHAISYQHILPHLERPYKEAIAWIMHHWLRCVLHSMESE